MSKYSPGNQKHLTLNDRIYIESALNKGTSFKDITRFLYKDSTTISKEVKARRASDWYLRASSITLTTSASIVIIATKPTMPETDRVRYQMLFLS